MNHELNAKDGYTGKPVRIRPLALAEVLDGKSSHLSVYIPHRREVRRVKVNGAVKTWKTRPGDARIPYKYGLYEYGNINFQNGELVNGDPVPCEVLS